MMNRIATIAVTTSIVCALAGIFVAGVWTHPHARAEDPEQRREYSECLQNGGTPKVCSAMLQTMKKVAAGIDEARDVCEAAQAAALSACVEAWQNGSYAAGEIDYRSTLRAEDAPRCEHIAAAAYYGCRSFKKGF